MVWVGVGLGTIFLGAVVLYWGEVKKWFKRRKGVVVEQRNEVNPKSVPEIVRDALVWAGCKRYLYRGNNGETGVVWAPSRDSAALCLAWHEVYLVELVQAEAVEPTEDDLIVYEEEV